MNFVFFKGDARCGDVAVVRGRVVAVEDASDDVNDRAKAAFMATTGRYPTDTDGHYSCVHMTGQDDGSGVAFMVPGTVEEVLAKLDGREHVTDCADTCPVPPGVCPCDEGKAAAGCLICGALPNVPCKTTPPGVPHVRQVTP